MTVDTPADVALLVLLIVVAAAVIAGVWTWLDWWSARRMRQARCQHRNVKRASASWRQHLDPVAWVWCADCKTDLGDGPVFPVGTEPLP